MAGYYWQWKDCNGNIWYTRSYAAEPHRTIKRTIRNRRLVDENCKSVECEKTIISQLTDSHIEDFLE